MSLFVVAKGRDGIRRKKLAQRFRAMPEDDLSTAGIFVIARRGDA